jgi:hypothetical protein
MVLFELKIMLELENENNKVKMIFAEQAFNNLALNAMLGKKF